MARLVILLHQSMQAVPERILAFFYKRAMGSCGKHVRIRPASSVIKGVENIYLGNFVSFPKHSTIYCTNAKLVIGNKVTFGPSPTIITGDHRFDQIGKYIIDNHDKCEENDLPVIIEDDVWVGANVTILKGVKIGRGSVIAACSLIINDVPPYSIVGGIPAKVLKFRFTQEEIDKHEKLLKSNNSISKK